MLLCKNGSPIKHISLMSDIISHSITRTAPAIQTCKNIQQYLTMHGNEFDNAWNAWRNYDRNDSILTLSFDNL